MSLKRRTAATIAVVAAGILGLAACSGTNGAGGGTGGPDGEVLRIGIITPLTGPAAAYGLDTTQGAELAVEQWNAKGDLPYTVELVEEDDASTPETGVLAYQKLRDEGIDLIGGTVNSSVAIAISNAMAADPGALYVITSAQTQEPLDQQAGNAIFGTQASNAMLADTNLSWIADEAQPEKVAVLVENTDFGIAEREQIEEHWSSGTPEVVLTETFDPALTDFSSILAKVRDSGADGIYVGAASATVPASIFTQADDLGMQTQKFINAGLMGQTLLDAGGPALNGITSAGGYHFEIATPENEEFVAAFQEKYDGELPADGSALGYETVNLMLQAVVESGSTDPQTLADTLHGQKWDTIFGSVGFDDTGRLQKPSLIITVEDEKIVLLDTVPVAG